MSCYDFKMLSDYEFELLTRDLLMRELNCNLENFPKGKDQGIDLRYSKNNENTIIVQCKHYANSTYSNLKNVIKKELPKIQKLNPTRYIFVTSLGLTPSKKNVIFNLLCNYCKSINDVIDKNSLNMLLDKYPEVEEKNYKLWLTSTNIMNKVLHSAAYNKNLIAINDIKHKFEIYVQNKSYTKAAELLKKQNVCIISGNPGVGKTTLANMLAIKYITLRYNLVKITQNINEAYEALEEGKKQIFIFDDFLGQTGLNLRLNNNEDNDIIKFIEYINKSKNKKIILTTRGYILNQAQENFEELSRYNFKISEITIELEDYTISDKCKILYNHLYFNKIDKKYVKNLLDNNIVNIIRHRNYNPRLIESITGNFLPENPNNFYIEFMKNLDDPRRIWEIAFNKHLSNYARNLVLIISTFSYYATNDELKLAFDLYNRKKCHKLNSECEFSNYKNALKELDDSFIKIDNINNSIVITYKNPSIKDFIENFLLENEDEFNLMCDSCLYFKQIKNMCDIYSKKHNDNLTENLVKNIIRIIKSEERKNGINGLIPKLSLIDRYNHSNINNVKLSKYIVNKIQDIIENVKTYSTLITFEQTKEIAEILKSNNILDEERNEIAKILNNNIDYGINDDMDEYKALKFMTDDLNFNFSSEIKNDINNMYKEFIEIEKERVKEKRDDWEIESLINDSNLLSSFFDYDDFDMLNELESIRDEINSEDETEGDDEFTQNENDISDKEIVDLFSRLIEN